MTSNIGSHFLLENGGNGNQVREETKEKVMNSLRGHFRPEFLNRVDDIILFKPLSTKEIKIIVEKLITNLQARLADKHVQLILSNEAVEYIVNSGFDPVYGARPLKRFIQRNIETKLAREIIAGNVLDHSIIRIELKNGQLHLDVN